MKIRALSPMFALLALAACSTEPARTNPYDPQAPATVQAKARLVGTVSVENVDGATDGAGVRVLVAGLGAETTSLEDGSWVVAEVPPGTYTIEASKDGYRRETVSGIVVELSAGGSDVAVPALALSRARGTLRGVATLEGEESFGGIAVLLSSAAGATQTDPRGGFVVTGVPTGTYEVSFSKLAFREVTVGEVVVAADATTELAPVALDPNPGSISGRVRVRGAADNSGVLVTADGMTLGGRRNVVQVTTALDPTGEIPDGAFTLSNVAAGLYNVSFTLEDHSAPAATVSVAPEIEVVLPAVELLRATGVATGTATLENSFDHAGIQVSLTPEPSAAVPAPEVAGVALTGGSGAWRVEGLPVGRYDVLYVKRPGYADRQGSLTVVRDATVFAADVELAEIPGRVEGRVLLEGIDPSADLSGTSVAVDTGAAQTTDASGRFSLEAAAGPHVLQVQRAGFSTGRTQLAVAAGDTLVLDDLTLSRARGAVHGTLLVEGRPTDASGVLVTLSSATEGSFTRLTDPEGTFRFTEVPVGEWRLDARLASYAGLPTATVQVTENLDVEAPPSSGPIESRTLALRRDASLGGQVSLELGLSPTTASARLVGLDLNGAPVAPAAQAPDASGAFLFEALPSGTYRIELTEPDHETLELSSTPLSAGHSVALSPVRMTRARGSIAGRFELALASSHEGIQLSARGTGPLASLSATALTDSAGAFALSSLAVGTWSLAAARGSDWTANTQTVVVTRDAVASLQHDPEILTVVAAGSVTGIARLEGLASGALAGTAVSLTGADFRGQSVHRSGTTADDGAYLFDALVAGDYQLRFEHAGFQPLSGVAVRVPSLTAVEAGEVLLSLSRGSVHGTLLVEGRPADASGVLVTLSTPGRPSLTALTDAAGAFRFDRVPVGSWSLDASLASYSGLPTAAVAVAADLDVEAPPSSGPIEGRTLALRRDAGLSGSARLASGDAAPGVSVELTGTDLNGAAVTASGTTLSTGAFTLSSLPPGSYRLSLTLADHEPVALGPLALAAGQTVTLTAATLERSRGDAAGQFLLAGAASHEDVRVTLAGTGAVAGTRVDVLTGADGRFSAAALPVGVYDVTAARAPDWTPAAGTLTVLRNQLAELLGSPLSLQVVASASVTGRVTVDKGLAEGTQVRLSGEDLRGQAVSVTSTSAADGSFSFTGLVGGGYQLAYTRASYDDFTSSLFSVASGAAVGVPDVELHIARGEIVGAVALQATAVPGFEVGADRSGVRVGLLDETAVEIASTLTDAAGGFRFGSVAVATVTGLTHRIEASREHFSPASLELLVLASGTTSAGPLVLELQPGTVAGHAFLHDAVGGAGRNPDSTGVELSVSGAAYNGVSFSKAGATSAADGSWSLAGLPPGTFEVRAASANRRCERGPAQAGSDSFPVRAGLVSQTGDWDCYDTLAPGALVLAAAPAWTNAASLQIALATATLDPTLPASNLRGYEYVQGRLPNWSAPAGLIATGPFPFALEPNAENTLWVRAVDWLDNAGPESWLTVRHDDVAPNRPTVLTPREFLNTTTTSVSLTGAEGDSTFDTYLACSAEQAPSLACPAAPSCGLAPSPSSFALALASGQRTCLWAQSRDLAGNLSAVSAPVSVLCDLSRPTAPEIAPVYEASAFSARAKSVDVFVTSHSLVDLPLGGELLPGRGIDHLEVDFGFGFEPLCPECRDPLDPESWNPCASGCTCASMVQCATIGRRAATNEWVTSSELSSLRVPLVDGTTNRISVRAVDLAGNLGDAASITVVAEGMRIFAQGAGTQAAPRFHKGSVAFVDDGAVRWAPLDANRTPSSAGCLLPTGYTDYLRSRSCETGISPEVVAAPADGGLAILGPSFAENWSYSGLHWLAPGALCPGGLVELKSLGGTTRVFTSVAASGTNLGWVEADDFDAPEPAVPDAKTVYTCQLGSCDPNPLLNQQHAIGSAAGPGHVTGLRAGGDYLLWAEEAIAPCPTPKYRWRLAYVSEAPAWQPSHPYEAGDLVWPTSPNGHAYVAFSSGTSGGMGVEPAWNTDPGVPIPDGTLSWRELSFSFEAHFATLSADGKLVFTGDNTGELTWAPSTEFSRLQTVRPTVPNGFIYLMWSSSGGDEDRGTSGATEPAWPTTTEATVVDGEVTWFAFPEATMMEEGNPPATLRVREIGDDRLWGTADDAVVENTAIGQMVEAGLAIEAGRAVAVTKSFDDAITVWDAAPDGTFKPDPSHLRHLVAKGGDPQTLELDQGLLVYRYGTDLVATDLSTLRWESAGEWKEHPMIGEDGTILFRGGGAESTLVARTPDGTETAGVFPSFEAYSGWMGPAVTRGNLLIPSETGLDVLHAGADGRFFTADDPLLVQVQSFGARQLDQLVAGGGNALWTLGDGTRTTSSGYVLLGTGGSLAGATPLQVGADDVFRTYAEPAISERFVALVRADTGQVELQYIDNGALGDAVSLDWLHYATLLEDPALGIGSNLQAEVRLLLASGPKLLLKVIPFSTDEAKLLVLDPGPNGRFASNLDLLEDDDRAVEVPLGSLVIEQNEIALGGDTVAFVASAPGLSAQLYSWRPESGALLQRTFHFSEKSDVQMAASGRIVWSDSLFDSRAVFVWLP